MRGANHQLLSEFCPRRPVESTRWRGSEVAMRTRAASAGGCPNPPQALPVRLDFARLYGRFHSSRGLNYGAPSDIENRREQRHMAFVVRVNNNRAIDNRTLQQIEGSNAEKTLAQDYARLKADAQQEIETLTAAITSELARLRTSASRRDVDGSKLDTLRGSLEKAKQSEYLRPLGDLLEAARPNAWQGASPKFPRTTPNTSEAEKFLREKVPAAKLYELLDRDSNKPDKAITDNQRALINDILEKRAHAASKSV